MIRYSYMDVCRRIQERVDLSGRPLKDIQSQVEITKDQWSRKMKVNAQRTGGTKTSWTYEELSRLANAFGADPGWPFIEWNEAASIRKALEALTQLRGQAAGEDQVAVFHERATAYSAPQPPRTSVPPGGPPAPPKSASPSAARPGSRKTGAGRH